METKSIKMKNDNAIRITAFTKNGARIGKFKSIHEFITRFGKGKLSCKYLKDIREGKLTYIHGYLLGLSDRFIGAKINPLRCGYLMHKLEALRRKNMRKLKKFNEQNQLIVSVDNNLKILGCFRGSIVELSKKDGVPSGTIKASIHKSPNGVGNRGRNSKYYIRLSDLPRFMKNMENRI